MKQEKPAKGVRLFLWLGLLCLLTAALANRQQPAREVRYGNIRLSGYSSNEVVLADKGKGIRVKFAGSPIVKLNAPDQGLEFNVGHVEARFEQEEGNRFLIKNATMTKGVSGTLTRKEDNSVTTLRADQGTFESGKEDVLTLRGNILIESDYEEYTLVQRNADRATVYFGKEETRIVMEGDPAKNEFLYIPKKKSENPPSPKKSKS